MSTDLSAPPGLHGQGQLATTCAQDSSCCSFYLVSWRFGFSPWVPRRPLRDPTLL